MEKKILVSIRSFIVTVDINKPQDYFTGNWRRQGAYRGNLPSGTGQERFCSKIILMSQFYAVSL